jgi:hypothetical protein
MTQKSPSIWNYKPWWCQPWSIILTGILLISGSWLLLLNVWITIFVAIPVLTWMIYFVLIFPKLAIASIEKDPSS